MPAHAEVGRDDWIPVVDLNIAENKPEVKECTSQTDGIFYPSACAIGSQKGSEFMKKMALMAGRDKVLKRPRYSPGKGKWEEPSCHVTSTP